MTRDPLRDLRAGLLLFISDITVDLALTPRCLTGQLRASQLLFIRSWKNNNNKPSQQRDVTKLTDWRMLKKSFVDRRREITWKEHIACNRTMESIFYSCSRCNASNLLVIYACKPLFTILYKTMKTIFSKLTLSGLILMNSHRKDTDQSTESGLIPFIISLTADLRKWW